jgi:hypothetical protein
MTDSDLQALFARLTAVRISHGDDRLWNSEVKRLVAEETQLELKQHFDARDRDYLNLHTKAELAELALAAGITVDVPVLKKSAAIDYLSQSARLVENFQLVFWTFTGKHYRVVKYFLGDC